MQTIVSALYHERYKKRLVFWSLATGIEAVVLIVGLIATEYIEIGLYDTGFMVVLLVSVFVLAPLMILAPVSAIIAVVYAIKLHKSKA